MLRKISLVCWPNSGGGRSVRTGVALSFMGLNTRVLSVPKRLRYFMQRDGLHPPLRLQSERACALPCLRG